MSVDFGAITQKHEKGDLTLFPGLCKGCGLCIAICPSKALDWAEVLGVYGTPSVVSDDKCVACGICQITCPECALAVTRNK
jgi:2-oxoglutarate ferredoxin oxidoreductase subunit delta